MSDNMSDNYLDWQQTQQKRQEAANEHDRQSGFFKLPERQKPCLDMAHNPPSHLYIPPGHGYRHICPSCGRMAILISPDVTC